MPLVIIVIGASGIIAQIVLIRELLVSFQGNELSIGFILGNWLLAEALGSYLAGKIKSSLKAYQITIIGFALLLPILIIGAMMLKIFIGIVPGEIVTLFVMFIASFIILFPISFIHGALFTSSVSVLTAISQVKFKVPGKVYIFENLGTIIGGILIAFILMPNFSSLQIAFIVAIVNIIAVIVLIKDKLYWLRIVNYVLLFIFIFVLFFTASVEHWINQQIYRDYEVLLSTNTIYSNIKVIKREEQYTFLIDGVPTVITPYPDINFVEDYVHFPLLFHSAPKKVLLISGGVGGILNEILKHPVERIDYLELDPNLIGIVKNFPTSLTDQELSDPRVKTINLDARAFLNDCQEKYDLIFINFLLPLSLQINRLFTKEFLIICRDRLNPEGILTTISVGSLSYISPHLRNVVNSHIATCKSVFPQILVIPGDFNLYLSFNTVDLKPQNDTINSLPAAISETLFQRLQNRKIKTNLVSLNYIKYRTNNYWQDWLKKRLQSKPQNQTPINQDGHPIGLFYSLVYWNTIVAPSLQPILSTITKINLKTIFLVLLLVFILLLFFLKPNPTIFLPFTIFTTGVGAMIFTLILSLGFQIRYGYLYYQISILLTLFILGNVLGGYVGSQIRNPKVNHLLYVEFMLVGLIILILLRLHNRAYPLFFNSLLDFYLSLFIAGLLTGLEYPIATRIYAEQKSDNSLFPEAIQRTLPKTAGHLYAADLLGGFISAIILSAIFIPIIGMFQTFIVGLGLKIISLLLVLTVKCFFIK